MEDLSEGWGEEAKRTEGGSGHVGPCLDDSTSVKSVVEGNSNGNATKKGGGARLKMLYGNKVDVERVIGTSMWESTDRPDMSATIDRSDSVTNLNDVQQDDDYINESK